MSESVSPPVQPRPGRARPWVIDAVLGACLSAALILIIATSAAETAGPGAYVFAVGFGALMLLRRHMIRSVLMLSVLGVFAYYTLDYPPIGVALPMLPALYSAAEIGRTGWAVGSGVVVFVVSMFFRLRDGNEAIGYLVGYESVSNIALFAAAITLGYGVRARRIRAVQQAEIARLTAEQLDRDAQSRIRTERERISRELHDTLGHTMSVISLHAGAGSESIGRDDEAARAAFERIRSASSRSLGELRSMVQILREDSDGERHEVRSLSALADLVDVARGAGIEVVLDVSVAPDAVSAPVDAAAYRVIQESITNVIRHSGATRATVVVGIADGRLRIRVSDDGHGARPGAKRGFGHAGMAERVRLLGGTFTASSGETGGYAVEAELPAELEP